MTATGVLKQFYIRSRKYLPATFDGLLSQLMFTLEGRPRTHGGVPAKVFDTISIPPFKYDLNGAFCISADFELAWAWQYSEVKNYETHAMTERRNIGRFLALFEKYKVPITWATVGHLFLNDCSKVNGNLAHPEMPRPHAFYKNPYWSFQEGDWYQHDPCTDFKSDGLWYAPDLIEDIVESPVHHELATHTFSHVDFSEANCSESLARKEIEKCIEVMQDFDRVPKSMVFPGNFVGHLSILYGLGLIAYRGDNGAQELSYPIRQKAGIWDIPASTFFREPRGYDFSRRAAKYINKAIQNRAVFHLWFHPSVHSSAIPGTFERILKLACHERSEKRLWIATMNEIATYCEARENTAIDLEKNDRRINIYLKSTVDTERFGDPEITLKIAIENRPKTVFINDQLCTLSDRNLFYQDEHGRHDMVVTVPARTGKIAIHYF